MSIDATLRSAIADESVRTEALTTADVRSAGIKVSVYSRLRVIHKFVILHDYVNLREVMNQWGIGGRGGGVYWSRKLRSFTDRSQFMRPIAALFKYFGSKLAFYKALVHRMSEQLIFPAAAGIIIFAVLLVPLKTQVSQSDQLTIEEKKEIKDRG